MIRIALYQPDIAQNTGTILRLCACLGLQGHIIEPAGFPSGDRAFRRAGMDYLDQAAEGALIPRLMGTYESELHPHLLAFVEAGLDLVIDVGCAEGYYAVGLARLMPEVVVHAHDIDEAARRACTELAARNGVSERVIVGGEFRPDGFEAFAGRRVLVMVDAEGA